MLFVILLTNTMQKNKAFFLDRDGVVIKDIPYLNTLDKIKILPEVKEAIKLINKNKFKCILITNQSGVARGLISLNELYSIHKNIEKTIENSDAKI